MENMNHVNVKTEPQVKFARNIIIGKWILFERIIRIIKSSVSLCVLTIEQIMVILPTVQCNNLTLCIYTTLKYNKNTPKAYAEPQDFL